ncbi:uncharacterized protein LOC114309754 isoform X2 [Camellia sinensis]|uniref:uncharacterized protein LOC114309754 isoform X2 n=1 Tax=Camellia sinensis TaxID=4442 RepID=UPI0010359EBB|nr:uncharacterized protein LOC114309754 isoform X2 [Camellia sinensis]
MCFCIKHGISHKIYISSGWNCCYPILPITVGIVAAISLLKLAIQSSAPAVVNPEMATITNDAVTANVGGDLNLEATDLPTSTMTFVVNPSVTSAVPGGSLSHHERPEKFARVNFKRWQQKMLFYLTTLNLPKVLSEDPPAVTENEPDRKRVMALDT